MKYTPRLPEQNVNVTPTSPLRELLVLLGGTLSVIIGFYILLGFAVDLIVPMIPPETEYKMAQYFIPETDPAEPVSEQSDALLMMVSTFRKECTSLPYDFHVHLNESPHMNAFALPGGHIVVLSGLIEKAESENELAFVLAHEMGHFANRDHLRALGRSLVFMVVSAVLFGGDSQIGNFIAGSINLTELNFSRKQETRADEYALELLNCYYGHTGGATDFFRKLGEAVTEPGKYLQYLSTHPLTEKRIAYIEAYSRARGFPVHPTQPLPPSLTITP